MAMPYRTLTKMTEERRVEITREANVFLDHMDTEAILPQQERLSF
jgi:hypothetical protein